MASANDTCIKRICLWQLPQPDCNLNQPLIAKSNILHYPLVVVVYRDFSATTTIEKQNQKENKNEYIKSIYEGNVLKSVEGTINV